ncbi:MAG: peptidylprolyl isomerase [Candidatus Omnitrophica bacterium]|nr:peptidylprolyl isomerase [Candidatus Omnitrophota bacterium]
MRKENGAFLIAGILALFIAAEIGAEDLAVSEGKKVKIDYTLTIEGQAVETSKGKEPLYYTHGSGQIIKGLEAALAGMKVGAEKKVILEPKDAYGEMLNEAIKEFPIEKFPKDPALKVGMVVEFNSPDGNVLPGIIWEIKEKTVNVNFNHPLAGKKLEFDVKVISIE